MSEKSICKYYSYSQGRCFPVNVSNMTVYEDCEECPVLKAGKECANFKYYGDVYGCIEREPAEQKSGGV